MLLVFGIDVIEINGILWLEITKLFTRNICIHENSNSSNACIFIQPAIEQRTDLMIMAFKTNR